MDSRCNMRDNPDKGLCNRRNHARPATERAGVFSCLAPPLERLTSVSAEIRACVIVVCAGFTLQNGEAGDNEVFVVDIQGFPLFVCLTLLLDAGFTNMADQAERRADRDFRDSVSTRAISGEADKVCTSVGIVRHGEPRHRPPLTFRRVRFPRPRLTDKVSRELEFIVVFHVSTFLIARAQSHVFRSRHNKSHGFSEPVGDGNMYLFPASD